MYQFVVLAVYFLLAFFACKNCSPKLLCHQIQKRSRFDYFAVFVFLNAHAEQTNSTNTGPTLGCWAKSCNNQGRDAIIVLSQGAIISVLCLKQPRMRVRRPINFKFLPCKGVVQRYLEIIYASDKFFAHVQFSCMYFSYESMCVNHHPSSHRCLQY